MGEHFLACRDLQPATAVHHAVQARLTDKDIYNLVLVRSNRIEVYEILLCPQKQQHEQGNVLRCAAIFDVAGLITSINTVSFENGTSYSVDGLLLAFADAKMSVVAYDPSIHEMVTLSIHNFEEESIGPGSSLQADKSYGTQQSIARSRLSSGVVDPQARCAAMVVYNDQLAIVPFRHSSNDFSVADDDPLNENSEEMVDGRVKLPTQRLAHQNESMDAEGAMQSLVQRPFILSLDKIDVTGRIIDIAFLHMYLEPTLVILHETTPSCAGRFATSRDTCNLTVLSLNVTQRLYPKIWTADGLPFNCHRVVPVPAPTGGVLVFATNSILYFNQTQYAGLALNSAFGQSTINSSKYKVERNLTDIEVLLEPAAQTAFLTPTEMLLSIHDGDLYLLKLSLGATSNQKLTIQTLGTNAVSSSCICQMNPHSSIFGHVNRSLLFFGSISGDSMLIEYKKISTPTEDASKEAESEPVVDSEPVLKKQKLVDDDDEEDIMLYGDTAKTSFNSNKAIANEAIPPSKTDKYEFDVVDSLLSLGQITSFTRGKSFIESEDSAHSEEQLQMDLITCGGFGNSAALTILHRGLRPIVDTEADLKGCRAMWTVKDEGSDQDSYLILSLGAGSMVLSTKGDEMELLEDDHEFYTEGPTLSAGNLFGTRRIVQVHRSGIRLLQHHHCTQEILNDVEAVDGGLNISDPGLSITLVDIYDPYVLLCLSDGSLRLVTGDPTNCSLAVSIPFPKQMTSNDRITIASLFLDSANLFGADSSIPETKSSQNNECNGGVDAAITDMMDESDDDDLALYATGSDDAVKDTSVPEKKVDEESGNFRRKGLLSTENSQMFCAVCRESGALEIFKLPEFQLVKKFPSFSTGPAFLDADADPSPDIISAPAVVDILIHRVGPSSDCLNSPYLSSMVLIALLTNGDLLMYAATELQSSDKAKGGMVFRRVPTGMISRPVSSTSSIHHSNPGHARDAEVNKRSRVLTSVFRYSMFTRYDNINSRSGIFFRGIRPAWVMADRGLPKLLLMDVAGRNGSSKPKQKQTVPVLCFTPFDNSNCPKGFIYFHSAGLLRVCQINDANTCYSQDGLVMRKIPLRKTPHAILYLGDTGHGAVAEALKTPTYAVVVSGVERWNSQDPTDDPAATYEQENQAGNEEDAEEEKNRELIELEDLAEAPMVFEEKFELRLIQANTWDMTGIFTLPFKRYEYVLSIERMDLSDTAKYPSGADIHTEWKAQRRPYLVIGTGFVTPEGEDSGGRGRLLLYEIDYAQYTTSDGSAGEKVPKLKLVYEKEHKQGAISMVQQMGPYVLAAVGSKIIAHELKSEQLVGCAFYDAQVFIVSLKVVKGFVMYADVYKSISFLRWNERERSLTLLAKDYEALDVLCTEFSISEKSLGLVAADALNNLSVFHFAPEDVQSRGGQRLVPRAEFHVGQQLNCMQRHQIPQSVVTSSKTKTRFATIMGSVEGGLITLVPVSERIFRRLYTLQTIMANALRQSAGMNPREFRKFRHRQPQNRRSQAKGVIDGRILWRYCTLDMITQRDLARCIGTTPDVVIQNMLEVENALSFL